jgi:tRNA pseudouridine13 synthase
LKLKQKPEDFAVTESWRFDEVPKGEHRVYAMDKQKISTFDAIGRLADEFGLSRSVFSYCGLKDKQGRTRQLIAVRGTDIDMQEPDLRLKYLGRTDKPLSAANTTSNRFGVTVRGLSHEEIARLPAAVAEVNRLGVVNYFDSQRFGSLKHGQGFIAKDLLRGDFEVALHNYLALPSDLDRSYDAKVKAYWRDHWGRWRLRCDIPGADKYEPILRYLRRNPEDFLGAFLRIDPKYRAMLVFTYQSFLWNESVRRYLMALLSGQSLLAISYQAGKLLFPREAPPEALEKLRKQTFPLLAPDVVIEDREVRRAVDWVLGREKLSLDKLRVPGTEQIFFKAEERPVLVYPGRLLVGPGRPDELNHGFQKVYVAFTLPPGAYATLVVRRLFSFSQQENLQPLDEAEAETASGAREARQASLEEAEAAAPSRPSARGARRAAPRAAPPEREPAPESKAAAAPPAAPREKLGFRAYQKMKKEKKAAARAAGAQRRPSKKK